MLKRYIKRNLLFVYIFLMLVLPICLEAVEFDYEKINDFAIGGNYYGNDKIIIDSSFMYIANRYGLEIQSIDSETGNLERIATMGFIGMSNSITKKDNFVYISSTTSTSFALQIRSYLYKIDVTIPDNPFIVDSLFCTDLKIYGLYFYNNNFIYHEFNEISHSRRLVFLNHQNLEEINSVPICCGTHPINDSLFITSHDGGLLYDIYNIIDINNIFIEATIDLTNTPSVISIHYSIQQIDSTTVGILGDEALAIWNISDIHNWEFITDYYTYTSYGKWADFTKLNDYIIIPQPIDGIEVVNISDIENPYFTCFWTFSENQLYFSGFCGNITNSNIKCYNNYVYWGTPDAGIFKYSFYNGIIEFIKNEQTHPNHIIGIKCINIVDDNIFIPTANDGIYVYNLSNIEIPELENKLLDSCRIWGSMVLSNKLYSTYVNRDIDIRLCVFNISNPSEPIMQCDFETQDGFGIPVLIINNNEPDMLYCFYWWWGAPHQKIVKYDMTDPTNPEIAFEYIFPTFTNGIGFFYNEYFYVLEVYSYPFQDLFIYGGFEENEPELVHTINNFGPYYGITLNKVENYAHMESALLEPYPEKFYIFETPLQLVEKFSTEYSLQQFSFINDDILFQVYEYCLGLFDLSGNPSGYLESFDYIYFNGWCPYLNFYTQNNNNYFISTQTECASIYSYNSNSSTDDENIYNNEISLYSHPNPFSTSTTISFKGKLNSHELSQIKIYNVKGQLVREFGMRIAECGFSVVWDGKDGSGKEVKNGVYLYKFNNNDEHIGKVVKLK
ncbi:MAG: hypothetical protein J7M10_01850 [Candidatus Cloacimonetes bacterium]|nr:hypothetical protein [Candidatus Cloacimonadota bacterium]